MLWAGLQQARHLSLVYHDRSHGGPFVAVAGMALAGRVGVELALPEALVPRATAGPNVGGHEAVALRALFYEELGMLVQVQGGDLSAVRDILLAAGFLAALHVHEVGRVLPGGHELRIQDVAGGTAPPPPLQCPASKPPAALGRAQPPHAGTVW